MKKILLLVLILTSCSTFNGSKKTTNIKELKNSKNVESIKANNDNDGEYVDVLGYKNTHTNSTSIKAECSKDDKKKIIEANDMFYKDILAYKENLFDINIIYQLFFTNIENLNEGNEEKLFADNNKLLNQINQKSIENEDIEKRLLLYREVLNESNDLFYNCVAFMRTNVPTCDTVHFFALYDDPYWIKYDISFYIETQLKINKLYKGAFDDFMILSKLSNDMMQNNESDNEKIKKDISIYVNEYNSILNQIKTTNYIQISDNYLKKINQKYEMLENLDPSCKKKSKK